jgi:hypothetical protein
MFLRVENFSAVFEHGTHHGLVTAQLLEKIFSNRHAASSTEYEAIKPAFSLLLSRPLGSWATTGQFFCFSQVAA